MVASKSSVSDLSSYGIARSPALSFLYTQLNRVIKKYDLDMIYMAGPGTAPRACPARPTSSSPIR